MSNDSGAPGRLDASGRRTQMVRKNIRKDRLLRKQTADTIRRLHNKKPMIERGNRFPSKNASVSRVLNAAAFAAWRSTIIMENLCSDATGNRRAVIACWFFTLFLAMILPASLSPQGSTGRISGHVADSTGAAIPDATITLTNTATSGVRSTVSTSSGD